MATKIIESKLIIRGEDQATPKLSGLLRFIDRLALKMEKLGKMGEPGQAYRTGAGAGRGSQRSEHAPPVGEYVSAPGGGYANILRQMGVPGAGGGSPPSPNRPLPPGIARVGPGGWTPPPGAGGGGGGGGGGDGRGGGFMRGVGWMAQGAGAYGSAMGGQLTPVVAGSMINIGAQLGQMQTPGKEFLNKVNPFGIPIGPAIAAGMGIAKNLTAATLTATGTAFMIQHAAAQKAIAHYQQLGSAYNIMGPGMSEEAKRIGAETGAYSPDEAIQLKRQLYGVGAHATFRPLAEMRYRGGMFETELMAPAMMGATRAGAIRPGREDDARKFAKILAVAFADKTKLPSMAQAMESMTEMLSISESHLGDIKDDQVKYLAGLTNWMQTGPATLRGPRGTEMMGGLMAKTAETGDPAMMAMKWKAFQRVRPGGGPLEFMYWQHTGEAAFETVNQFGMGGGAMEGQYQLGPLMAGAAYGMSPWKIREMQIAQRENPMLSWEELQKKRPDITEASLAYKPGKGGEPIYVTLERERRQQEAKRLGLAETLAPGAQKFETAMVDFAAALNKETHFSIAMANFGTYVTTLVEGLKSFAGKEDKLSPKLVVPGTKGISLNTIYNDPQKK